MDAHQKFSIRNRKGTRAAVLEALLLKGSAVRGEIARITHLSEASVSRILTELRQEKLIEELRVSAPYVGGPTALITLCKDVCVIGAELANDRLSFGVGPLAGAADYADTTEVGPRLAQAEFETRFDSGFARLKVWLDERNIRPRWAAMAIPGLLPGRRNPILPWDDVRLAEFLADRFNPVPVELTNTVVAQAVQRRYSGQNVDGDDPHLFVFLGHGVAGTLVQGGGAIDSFRPYEIGHMIVERAGRPCRCGHHGCLEAYVSVGAISSLIDSVDIDLSGAGGVRLAAAVADPERGADLRNRLELLGLAIGNALNLNIADQVQIAGWPALLPDIARHSIMKGMSESLLGDVERVSLGFVAPAVRAEPRAALYFAAHRFVASGAPAVKVDDASDEAVA